MTPRFIREQIERLSGLGEFPAGDAGRRARKELGAALNTAKTEHQAQSALTKLIREEQRRFCPSPGEIVAAVQSAPLKGLKPAKRSESCPKCHGLGWAVRHFRMPDYPYGPREYLSAEEEEKFRLAVRPPFGVESDAERCDCKGGAS